MAFDSLMHVVAIATEGRNTSVLMQWVTSYQLGFSQTGESWTLHRESDTVKVKSDKFNKMSNNDINTHIICSQSLTCMVCVQW